MNAELLRALSLLVEAVAIHSPNLDTASYAYFRDSVRSLRAQLEKSPGQAFALTVQIVQLLESTNRGLETKMQQETMQMREVAQLALQAAVALAEPGCSALAEVATAEKELQRHPRGERFRDFRSRLKDSLSHLIAEAAERRRHILDRSHAPAPPAPEILASAEWEQLDPITGLPNMVAAEFAIAGALAAPADTYLGIFTVERLNAVNARYGFATGDRLMMDFAQELAQHFSGTDRLFRWGGPTMIALAKRTGRLLEVRTEMGLLAATKRNTTIELQGREVFMSIAVRSAVIALEDEPAFESILETLNTISSY